MSETNKLFKTTFPTNSYGVHFVTFKVYMTRF